MVILLTAGLKWFLMPITSLFLWIEYYRMIQNILLNNLCELHLASFCAQRFWLHVSPAAKWIAALISEVTID